jgi:DNA transposition AAA+ family ATPase
MSLKPTKAYIDTQTEEGVRRTSAAVKASAHVDVSSWAALVKFANLHCAVPPVEPRFA